MRGKLFPAHPKPFKDEVLTSWVIRLAKANGLKLQAFSRIVFKGQPDLWNRDMDRKPFEWLINELSIKTNCSKDEIFTLTLQSYKGALFPYFHDSGILKWILPLNVYHRKRKGFGQQYCSQCLKEDDEPYLRKHWRVAFSTFCTKHQIMHRDRCPECQYPVMFHRSELGKPRMFDGPEMCFCTTCEFDLRKSEPETVNFIDVDSRDMFVELGESLQCGNELSLDVDNLAVLRQLCKLINSSVTGQKLCGNLIKHLQLHKDFLLPNHMAFELADINQRHNIIQFAIWILRDWENVLEMLWKNKAFRYNHLIKDFPQAPKWFSKHISKLNRLNF